MQQKTKTPVQFEITKQTRDAIENWININQMNSGDYLFPSKKRAIHLSTRQYSRVLNSWLEAIDLDPSLYGTHSLRRTKATLIYKRTKIYGLYNSCSGTRN